jgi:hypothetical protein
MYIHVLNCVKLNWPTRIEYHKNLHFILCMIYRISINVYASMSCMIYFEIVITLITVQLELKYARECMI